MDNAAQNNEKVLRGEATDKRLPHSQLIQYLKEVGTAPRILQIVLEMTRHGVFPEGAELRGSVHDPKLVELNRSVIDKAIDSLMFKQQSWPNTLEDSRFKFGRKSCAELEGIDPLLEEFARRTLSHSEVDFMVFDGLRTPQEQRDLVARGASKTMQSYHLRGKAVDLVPIVDGIPKWDWEPIYFIVCAADRAATELGIAERITWGGAWDRRLSDFGGNVKEIRRVVEEYCERHPGKDFIDGPHFQLEG